MLKFQQKTSLLGCPRIGQSIQQLPFWAAFIVALNCTIATAQTCSTDGGTAALSSSNYTARVSNADLGVAADFNLFVFGNAEFQSSDVEGRTAISGNANFTSGFNISQGWGNYPNNCNRIDFVVGGSIYGNGAQGKGSARYGGSTSSTFYMNSNCSILQQSGVIDFTNAETNLKAKSTAWGSLAATGTATYNINSHLQLTGTNTDVNVFNITTADLTNIYQIYVDVPNGASTFINVSGTNADPGDWMECRIGTPSSYVLADNNVSEGTTAYNTRSRMFWNFYQATNLTISNIGWQGSVLAPFATFQGTNGNFNGNLIVGNIASSGAQTIQINYRPFLGCLPTATPPAPACDNITNAGQIGYAASGCTVNGGSFDPPLINSITDPSGGTGALEIIWIYLNTSTGGNFWQVSGATGLTYDPPAITETTTFRRCSRRAGCTDFVGESNDIIMTLATPPNFTISNTTCTQGTNTTDTSDDRWSMTVNATAGSDNSGFFQIVYNGNVIESGSYGTPKTVDMGLISNYGATATIQVRDGGGSTCAASQNINTPTGCSPPSCAGFTFTNKSVVCNGTSITICYNVEGAANKYWGTSIKYTNDINNHGYMANMGFGNQINVCHTITDPTEIANIVNFNSNYLVLWGMITNNAGDNIYGTDCVIDHVIGYSCCTNTGAAITGNTSFCAGGSTTLTATGGSSYAWSNGASGASLNVTTAGTYTVTATTGTCTATASVTVTTGVIEPGTLANGVVICNTTSYDRPTITATAATCPAGNPTYQWQMMTTTTMWMDIAGATNESYDPPAQGVGSLWFRRLVFCQGCATSAVTAPGYSDVHVYNPTVSISGNNTVCAGATTTLTAIPAGIYNNLTPTYNWSNGQSGATITASAGTYTVTVIDATIGCSSTASITINTESVSATAAKSNDLSCTTTSATLTATGGNTYAWSNGATGASITTNTGGTFTVTATSTNGCTATAAVSVTENTTAPVVVASSATICVGNSANITASGASTYTWNTGSTDATLLVSPNTTTTYTVTGTAANGCTATATSVVTVNAAPNISITGAGNGCVQGATTLTANGGASYIWNDGSTGATLSATPTTTATYTVTATSADGCTATASVTLNAVPTILAISAISKLCLGSATNLMGNAPGAIAYAWSTGSAGATINVQPAQTTLYTVTATFASGCIATATVNLEVLDQIIVSDAVATNTTSCTTPNGTITVTASGSVSTALQYRLGTGAWQTSNVFNGLAAGNYVVQVRYLGGYCAFYYGVVTVGSTPPSINAVSAAATICAGSGTDLTASGGVSYSWNTNATGAVINVEPAQTTTYTVTATAANGCTGTAAVTVTVKELIITSSLTANNLTSCTTNNGSIIVNATGNSGALQYRLNGGAWQTSNTFTGLAAGNYTAEVSYVGNFCAYSFVQTTLTAPVAPVVVASSATICAMGSTSITASGLTPPLGAGGYVWNTGANTASLWVMPNATTTYTVTGTAANGCTATATSVVTVNPLPTANINPANATIFTGSNTTLTATGGGTYTWSNGTTNASITVTQAGTYTVTVTDANGCTKTATAVVTENATPTVNNATICAGATATLTATGGTSYTWNNGEATASISVAPNTTTTYTVTVTNGAISTTLNAVVTVNTSVAASITGVQGSCYESTATLTANDANASGVSTYIWNTGSTNAAITVTPTATTNYTVTITNASGCTGVATKTLKPAPSINAVSAAATICAGSGTNLTASGGVSYIWNTNDTDAVINVEPAQTTTYTVTATATNGCTGTAAVTVTVKELIITSSLTANNLTSCTTNNGSIIVNATGNSGALQYRLNGGAWQSSNTFTGLAAGNYTAEVSYVGNFCAYSFAQTTLTAPNAPVVVASSATICAMGSTSILASGASTYVWNTGANTASLWVMPNATITYKVTGTAANGCTATATSVVTVNALPTASITGSNTICAGGSIVLTATGAGTPPSGAGGYLWNNNTTNATLNVTTAGTYTVTVTNAEGCTKTVTKVVATSPLFTTEIITDGIICGNGSVDMTAQNGVSYLWNNGSTLATLVATTPGIYTVTATNASGCTATATAEIERSILPIINVTTATGTTSVCESTPINITAFSAQGIAYLWNTGAATATISVTPTQTTTYTVTVTSPKGCTATATITLITKPCGTASIGDFVWFDGNDGSNNDAQDTGESGVAGVTVTLYDANGATVAVTQTNALGYYLFANLFAGNYSVGFTPLAGLSFVNQTLNDTKGSDANPTTGITPVFALANGQNRTDIDAGLKQTADIKGSLGNKVWYDNDKNGIQNDNEAGVPNVTVNLFATDGARLLATTTTNAFGEYIFTNLDPTGYRVQFVLPANYVFTTQNVGEDQTDSDADFTTGFTNVIILTKGENNTTVDAGIYKPTAGTASVGDFVWIDKDIDGIQDADERGAVGIKVTLLAADGTTVIATTFTNENGYYLFSGLDAGSYMVAFEGLPTNFIFTSQTLNTANGSDANSIGRTPVFSLNTGEAKRDIDAGIFNNGINPRDAAALGNFVWNDIDGNGRQDAGEPGVSGVSVGLFNSNNILLAKTTTDRDGFYEFLGLPAGSYYVVFSDLPQDVVFTTANGTPDDTRDSDANQTTGRTQTVNLAANETNHTLDAGVVIPALLGDFVWLDTDKNGAQNIGEGGIKGVTVELFAANDLNTVLQTAITDDNGIYFFKVLPNTYIVKFALANGYNRTTATGGGDNDSDANDRTGLTAPVTISAGEKNPNIDAGYTPTTLPVKLLYFLGSANNCIVELKWQTATELNNKEFTIQRSSDGLSFVSIGTIRGSGTINTPQSYTFTDNKPTRKNYYRMLQTDFDGTTTIYSSANEVNTNGCFDDTSNGVDALYPNPNKTNIASFKFYTEQADEQVNIEIFDNLGRTIQTIPANVSTGPNVVSFDITNLVAGTYTVRIKGNGWFTNGQRLIRM
jgi:choice-of-anchor A domain-containing protein